MKTGLPEYPFAPHFFAHPHGAKQHYLDEGPRDGEVVLMLHGNPTWSYYYRNVVAALCDQRRCVVPDHIGMGWSDKPDDSRYAYSLQQRVDDLDALVASLDLGNRITLVVHDWGGMIGFAWASRHPERIARLVVLNTAAFPMPSDKSLPSLLRLGRDSSIGAWLIEKHNAFAHGATHLAVKHGMSSEIRDAYLAPYDTPANRISTLRFVQDIPLSEADRGYDIVRDTGAKLPQFANRPALIGWGLKDFVFDAKFLREFRRALPNAEVHEYADAGHYVLEDARDRLIPAIVDFLDRHPV
jgi:pimeloyl-ACP methyl ester carboxylesterase